MRTLAEREALFRAWWQEHRGIVVKVARSFAPADADAADLQQELLLQLWLSLPTFAGQAKASTWIYRVCLNTALTWRRGNRRRERRLDPAADVMRMPSADATPADRTADREMLEKLYASIRLMSDFDRALVLLALDGLAYREIAEITGLTENHVGVALTRARRRLAALMKGVTDERE